ncbi:MAG: CoA-transferase [Dehalococcoidia bacterium]|nr:CoA-transferase [Dehalococcoidia bacterium]
MGSSATRFEMMIVAASRELRECRQAFIGFHWPVIASRVARRLYRPDLLCAYEGGFIEDTLTETIPTSNNDLILAQKATMCGDSLETIFMLLRAGWIETAVLDGFMVDRYGNINSTCLGAFAHPTVRLAGSGGATELAAFARRLIILSSATTPDRYPERVDFITSAGYLTGGNSRREAGFKEGTGPTALINPLGRFCFDPQSKEMVLEATQPGVSMKEVQESIGWPLKTVETVVEVEPATALEIETVREELAKARKRLYKVPT